MLIGQKCDGIQGMMLLDTSAGWCGWSGLRVMVKMLMKYYQKDTVTRLKTSWNSWMFWVFFHPLLLFPLFLHIPTPGSSQPGGFRASVNIGQARLSVRKIELADEMKKENQRNKPNNTQGKVNKTGTTKTKWKETYASALSFSFTIHLYLKYLHVHVSY